MSSPVQTTADLQAALQSLTATEQKEIQNFVQNETQRMNLQESIHNFTSICFKKCVTSRISSATLDKYEEPCLQNCVSRFLDAQTLTLRRLTSLKGEERVFGA